MTYLARKQTVLVVDDELDLLNVYKLYLKPLQDVDVITFTCPLEALSFVKKNVLLKPDLLISDYMMPNMKGIDLIREMFELRPELHAILLSAYIDKEKAIESANLGFVSILEKPVSRDGLQAMARSFLRHSRSVQLRKEMTGTMNQMVELFQMFRTICIDELSLQSINEESLALDIEAEKETAFNLEDEIDKLEKKLKDLEHEEELIRKAS
ncbi:response regulator [bacterium]|nr:response regulator [bacterium]